MRSAKCGGPVGPGAAPKLKERPGRDHERSARRAALSPQASQQLSNDAPQDGGVIARIEQGRIVRPAHDEQAKKAA